MYPSARLYDNTVAANGHIRLARLLTKLDGKRLTKLSFAGFWAKLAQVLCPKQKAGRKFGRKNSKKKDKNDVSGNANLVWMPGLPSGATTNTAVRHCERLHHRRKNAIPCPHSIGPRARRYQDLTASIFCPCPYKKKKKNCQISF